MAFGAVGSDVGPVGRGLNRYTPEETAARRAAQKTYRPEIGASLTDAEYAQRGADEAAASRPAPTPAPVQQQRLEPSPQPLQDAYQGYLASPRPARVRPQTTAALAPASTPPSVDLSPVTALIQSLTQKGTDDAARIAAERAQMREMLLQRIGQASAPVDVNSPGIKQTLAAQRLARQRSAERQRSQNAARLSVEGLLDSGANETNQIGIEQMRGEGESGDIAAALLPEHQAKRQELLQLYTMALGQGETEQAMALQQQLKALDATMAASSLQESGRRFDEDAKFRRSSFLDQFNLQRARGGL